MTEVDTSTLAPLAGKPVLPSFFSKPTLDDVLKLLKGWSDSDFATVASGEDGEDLKAVIEGAISRALDPGDLAVNDLTADDSNQPLTYGVTLIDQLNKSAERESEFSRQMAQDKSLRQTDNPEKRDDLYMWAQPGQTLSGRAATLLSRLTKQLDNPEAFELLCEELNPAHAKQLREGTRELKDVTIPGEVALLVIQKALLINPPLVKEALEEAARRYPDDRSLLWVSTALGVNAVAPDEEQLEWARKVVDRINKRRS